MKIRSSLVLSLMLIFSNNITANAMNISDIFNDVKSHWAQKQISDFYEKGYINGYEDGTFKPNNNMTRAEFVKTFNRVFGLTNKSGKVFDDTKGHWAKDEIDIAVTNGVCNGISESKFEPNRQITRQEMCKMIANYLNISDKDHDKLDKFNDKPASWAEDAVEAILENGIMQGYEGNYFKPFNNSTRAEVVTTLSRINIESSNEESNKEEEIVGGGSISGGGGVAPGVGGGSSVGTTPSAPSGDIAPSTPSTGGGSSVGSGSGSTTPSTPDIVGGESGVDDSEVNAEKVEDVVQSISEISNYMSIDKPDEIYIDSPEKLDTIEEDLDKLIAQYNLLNDAEKAKVGNIETLQKAKASAVDARQKLSTVDTALNDIPKNINKSNIDEAESAVLIARSLYRALPDNYKNGVDSKKYKMLEESEKNVSTLKESISAEKVSRVNELIEKIDTNITLNDEYEIEKRYLELDSIQREYDLLDEKEKDKIINYDKLKTTLENVKDAKEQIDAINTALKNIPKDINESNVDDAVKYVTEAKKLYSELKDDYKNGINLEKYSIVQSSEDRIKEVKQAISDKKVNSVIDSINAINVDSIIITDRIQINTLISNLNNIDSNYKALTPAEQVKVENYTNLGQAISKVSNLDNQVHNVIRAINKIPDVKEGMSKKQLQEAQVYVDDAKDLYNALPQNYKGAIYSTELSIITTTDRNIQRLINAIDHANDEEVVTIQEKINNLPTLTKEDMDAYIKNNQYKLVEDLNSRINEIFSDISKLTTEQKDAVNREKIDGLYKIIIYANAKIIEKEIAKLDIDKVDESYKEQVIALYRAYENLEHEGRLLVKNYSYLRDIMVKLGINYDLL